MDIPHDPHLATGGRIELARLDDHTLDAFLQLAALVTDLFPSGSGAPPRVSGMPDPDGSEWVVRRPGDHVRGGPTLER